MDEKKKLMVVGALAVVMVGVGVFSFSRGSGEATAAPAAEAEKTLPVAASEDEAAQAPKNPVYAMGLKRRDPFAMPMGAASQPVDREPVRQAPRTIRGNTGGFSTADVRPVGLGNIAPMPGTTLTVEPTTGVATPVPVPEQEAPFSYKVSGVVIGRTPAVVFTDAAGNQKLVSQGASLDGDTQVQSVKLNHVSVRYKGKTLRLPIGGDSVAK